MAFIDQFREEFAKICMLKGDDRVLLAVSGGSDSMVMAHLFLNSAIPFAVAHCNFGLRGADSDLDERLVSDWCYRNNVRLHSVRFDTKKTIAEWKMGTQEGARKLRYDWFETLCSEFGYKKIVTAHHANDNVETLLINLFKGTGISGLHGIRPENGNIVRPMLFATKEQIMAYADVHQVVFREDVSNTTDDYLRNDIRHNLIPVIERMFPNAVRNVNDSIVRFAEAEQLYKKAIAEERKKLLQQRGQDYYLPILKLKHRQPLATIIYELLQPFGFSSGQIPQIVNLLQAETGKYVSSGSHRVIKNRDFLIITTLPTEETDFILVSSAPCEIVTPTHKFTFTIADRPAVLSSSPDVACLSAKHISFPLILRRKRTGDYFYPLGMDMKKKKVSRLLIDLKTSLPDKENVWLLECSKRIAWVAGIRIDERYKVTDNTDKVLMVTRTAI